MKKILIALMLTAPSLSYAGCPEIELDYVPECVEPALIEPQANEILQDIQNTYVLDAEIQSRLDSYLEKPKVVLTKDEADALKDYIENSFGDETEREKLLAVLDRK